MTMSPMNLKCNVNNEKWSHLTSFNINCKRYDCVFIVSSKSLRNGIKCSNCGVDESKLKVVKRETLLELMAWYYDWMYGSGEYSGKKTEC